MAKQPKQKPQQADQINPPMDSKEVAPEVTSASTDQPKPKKTETIYGLKVESF